MNILIIGGLLGLAVLAILGAVLLGLGEDRADKARKAAVQQQASTPTLLPQQSQSLQTVSQELAYPSASTYQTVPATPMLSRPTIPLPVSSTGESTGSLSLANLNGQVSEIASELHTLAQRAGEIQQRLTALSEILSGYERPHFELSHDGIPEDLYPSDSGTQVL